MRPGGETERALFQRTSTTIPKPKKKPEPKPRREFDDRLQDKNADTPIGQFGQLAENTDATGLMIRDEIPPALERKAKQIVTPLSPEQTDATGRMIREPQQEKKQENNHTPPIPQRKPEIISPTRKGNKILDFIGKIESSDNYNVIVGGDKKPLTNMTVKEIYQLQEELINKGQNSAVGRYQIKNSTLKETVDVLGIDENEIFDEKLQDKMARRLLTKRGYEEFRVGKITTKQFIRELSKEWAAFPEDESNQSYHKGVGNNKALADFKTVKDLLERP